MGGRLGFILLVLVNFVHFGFTSVMKFEDFVNEDILTRKAYVFWPNATIPFYIVKENYDFEQQMGILQALNTLQLRTCLQFVPVMAMPRGNEHVLVIDNPTALRKCFISTEPHSTEEPHFLRLGYDCLSSPDIEMVLMKALGFPFEHNRAIRSLYIDVLEENIEPGFLELFTRDPRACMELRSLPYDQNSVMHFGERDFSKNGHRTIIFKDHKFRQERCGFTKLDLKKIDIIYGPECRNRDRLEKIEICQSYPGVSRKKRAADGNEASAAVKEEAKAATEAAKAVTEASKAVPEAAKAVTEAAKAVTQASKAEPEAVKAATEASDSAKAQKTEETTKVVDRAVEDGTEVSHFRSLRVNRDITPPPDIEAKDANKIPFSGAIPTSIASGNAFPSNIPFRGAIPENISDAAVANQNIVSGNPFSGAIPANIASGNAFPANIPFRGAIPANIGDAAPAGNASSDATQAGAEDNTTTGIVMRAEDYADVIAKKLGIEKEMEDLIEQVHKMAGVALDNVRTKYCNRSDLAPPPELEIQKNDEINFAAVVAGAAAYATSVVNNVMQNLTEFCLLQEQTEDSQRKTCPFFASDRCVKYFYKSTKTGPLKPSTKHRPFYAKSTIHKGRDKTILYVRANIGSEKRAEELEKQNNRDLDENESTTEPVKPARKKREVAVAAVAETDVAKVTWSPKNDPDSTLNKAIDESAHDDRNIKNRNKRIKTERRKFRSERYSPKKAVQKNDDRKDWSFSELSIEKRSKTSDELGRNPRGTLSEENNMAEKREKKKKKKRARANEETNERSSEEQDDNEFSISPRPKVKSKGRVKSRETTAEELFGPARLLPRTVKLSKKNREFYDERKWPDRIVRYILQPGENDLEDVRQRLGEVDDILRAKTCVRIEEITDEQTENFEDYLVLDTSPDYVTGRVGGRQQFGVSELLKGGQHRQHSAMMVMAMLGFYFEVSRHDRDKYIRVHMRHVRPDKLHHFEKIREDATFPLEYDFKSATHPAWQFWRQIGRTGISTVATFKENDPDGRVMKMLGQNDPVLSELDIVKINSVYGVDCFRRGPSHHKKKLEDD